MITSLLFKLEFCNNTILLCFFFLFLIIDLYFLIPAAIGKIFNFIAEIVIHLGITMKEAIAKIEIYPVIAETKIRKCSIKCRFVQTLLCVY